MRAGDTAHAGRDVEASLGGACEQVGQGERGVQYIARARQAAGGVMPMQLGVAKGKGGKKGKDLKGKGELLKVEKEKEDAKKWPAKNKDKTYFCRQRKGNIKSDCKKPTASHEEGERATRATCQQDAGGSGNG